MAHHWHYGSAMRWLTSVLGFASLAACTDTGAHLTLVAPDGPATAETFQVVLATPDQVPEIRDQRLAPGDRSTTAVRYFLQRTLAGAETDKISDVDGFTVRIAPDASTTETQFIPFVLIYDRAGAITGIGTYRAGEDNLPSPILVMRDEIDKYKLRVERATQIDDPDVELLAGEVRVVTCPRDDGSAFTSGIAWHTQDGEEYRLLFPLADGLDATGRLLDMDCDGHEVTPESSYRDCDDTRLAYHRDAEDVCDGKDTNCDGAQTLATACNLTVSCSTFGTATSPNGVQLCNDETVESTSCHANATCACSSGSNSCRYCKIPVEPSLLAPGSEAMHPCQPVVGLLNTRACSASEPCDIEILAVRGGWKVKISSPETNAFANRAYDVGENVAIKVERSEGPAYELTPTDPVMGEVDLAILTETATVYMPLQLRLDDFYGVTCSPNSTLSCN